MSLPTKLTASASALPAIESDLQNAPVELSFTLASARRETSEGRSPRWYIEGRASTPARNRYGFNISAEAWKKCLSRLSSKFPVILLEHEPMRSIGRVMKANADTSGLYFAGWVTDQEVGPKLEPGPNGEPAILSDFSVRFHPLDVVITELAEGDRFVTVTDLDWLEVSITGIPADTTAQAEKVKRKLSASPALPHNPKTVVTVGGSPMLLAWLIAKLSLNVNATEAEVVSVLTAVLQRAQVGETLSALAQSLGCEPTVEAIRQTIATARAPENFVAKAEFDRLQLKLNDTLANSLLSEFEDRIPESLKALARRLALQPDRKEFDDLMNSLTPVPTTPLTRKNGGAAPPADPKKVLNITSDDEEWRRQLGYFKTSEEMAAAANTAPHEALSKLWPALNFGPTKLDENNLALRQMREAV